MVTFHPLLPPHPSLWPCSNHCWLMLSPSSIHETSGAPKRFSMNFPVSLEVSPISVSTPLNNRYLSLKHDVIHHTHSCNYNTKRKIISGSILKGLLMSHILWPLCCCLFVPCYIKQNLKKKNQHQLSVLTSPFLIKLF